MFSGLPVGVAMAVWRGSLLERALAALVLAGQSLPTFWSGILLILLFGVTLGWLPTSGAEGIASLILPSVALGAITSHQYSADHPSEMNKKFVAAFKAANKGMRPNFFAVSGYDGMHVIYNALKQTKGAGGQALLDAMKGQTFESPRGEILIDAQTRDIVQDVYIRKVERKNGELYNVEFDVQKAVKDPGAPVADVVEAPPPV